MAKRIMVIDSKGLSQVSIPKDFGKQETQESYYKTLISEVSAYQSFIKLADLSVTFLY